ncbi:DUF6527 family protein [Sphingomonas sp. CARO-RG-8B-R24-01]|uniref:DUF6527 family protein n=1 Tax=Sphingomonas sp. CARO-RG-8B-R24-01 TaxID=2914831 RepID=UPI001F5839CC|nr:DUF6527 family protein [Sphingomonas sp. CARO-RG-8B-R24-01]
MGALSPILRGDDAGSVMFWCPGCKEAHRVSVDGAGAIWGWNRSADRPTFTPSVLIRSGHYVPSEADRGHCWCTYNAAQVAAGKPPAGFTCSICHSFVTDGRIQFLGDCTHALAGQTVDLPEFPA